MKIGYILILTLAAGLAARADFSYTSTRKPAAGQTASNAGDPATRHYIKGQKMKMDRGRTATLIDFDQQTVTSIDNDHKTYTVTKFSDFGQALQKSDVEVNIDVKKTGETRNVNGYNANEMVMTMDLDSPQGRQSGMKMQMEMHMWLSADVPGAGELRAFYDRNRDRFPWSAMAAGGSQNMQKAIADMQRKMADMHGVPVLQEIKVKAAGNEAQAAQMQQGMAQARAKLEEMQKQGGPQAAAAAQALARMGGGSAGGSGALFETTMESSDFSTSAIPDSVFAIPDGYQKTDKK
jgi:hypothetical protein